MTQSEKEIIEILVLAEIETQKDLAIKSGNYDLAMWCLFKSIDFKNKLNNNVENLEWCNQSYNIKHDFKKGNRSLKGEKNTQAKLTEKIVKEIRKSNKTQNEIALKYGVHQTTIHLIKSNKRWNFI